MSIRQICLVVERNEGCIVTVYVWMDFDLTYTWHAVLRAWSKQVPGLKVIATVSGIQYYKWLKKQTGVCYENVELYQDLWNQASRDGVAAPEFLQSREKIYGDPCLWHTIFADKDIVREPHEVVLKKVTWLLRHFEELFNKYHPEAYVTGYAANFQTVAIYRLARSRNMKMAFPIIRFPGHILWTNNPYENIGHVMETYRTFLGSGCPEELNKKVSDYIDYYVEKKMSPIAHLGSHTPKSYWLKHYIKSYSSYAYEYYITGNMRRDYTKNHPLVRVWQRLTGKFFRWFDTKYCSFFDSKDAVKGPFVYFPLQLVPEAALDVLSPWLQDQSIFIEWLAKALPVHYKLVLKEHPIMLGKRPNSYYKKLRSYPNVVLAPMDFNSHDLIKRADLVCVITGTSGWEACLYGKPVLLAGRTFFCELDFVNKGLTAQEVRENIRKALVSSPEDADKRKQKSRVFLGAIFHHASSGDFNEPLLDPYFCLGEENISQVTAGLLKHLSQPWSKPTPLPWEKT